MEEVTCNFCGLTIDEVEHMVAGPNVFICNECIELCTEIWKDVQTKRREEKAYVTKQHIADNL